MLEVFGIMMLCKLNKKNAIARGRRPGGYIALTICLWVGLEIIGFIIGAMTDLQYGYALLGYGFAGIGGASSNHGCTIDICGGYIVASGDTNASGIGGGGTVCTVNIYGGKVYAYGGTNGSGIGGTNLASDPKANQCAINLIGGMIFADSYIGTVKLSTDADYIAWIANNFINNGYPVYLVEVG